MKTSSEVSVLTMGCAITLGGEIARRVVGKNISDTLSGEVITPNQLYQVIGQRIAARLIERVSAKKGA